MAKKERTGGAPSRSFLRDLVSADLSVIMARLVEKVPFLLRVSNVEKVTFTKNLSTLIQSGINLAEALQILEEQSSANMRLIVRRVKEEVMAGETLTSALLIFPNTFSDLFVNIVQSGEQSGTLDQSLRDLSEQLTKSHELRVKVRSAMMYPLLILSVTFFIGLGLGIFILPKLKTLFVSLDSELPFLTRAILWFADLATNYGTLLFFGVIIFVIFFFWVLQLKFLRPYMHWLFSHVPLFGPLIRYVNLALFSRTLGTLLQSGVQITEALEITSRVVRNHGYQNALMKASGEIDQGTTISASLAGNKFYFPTLVTRMIDVGEDSGRLEEVLKYIAEFYELEVDTRTKNLYTLIEPFLLFVIGAFVGLIALGIISPIYQLIDTLN